MQKIKEWLLSALGGAGYFVFLFLIVVMNILPMIILDFQWWVMVLVVICLTTFEFLQFPYLGIWIWAFVVAVKQPIDWVTILFFVAFAIYFGTIIVSLFSSKNRY